MRQTSRESATPSRRWWLGSSALERTPVLMSVHAADVLRCEEIFRAHSGESVEAGWSDAIFLSVHEILQFVFQSAWTSKKEESRVSTSTPSEASQRRSRDTELNVTSHPYSFPLMRSGRNEVLRNASFPRTGSLACFIRRVKHK